MFKNILKHLPQILALLFLAGFVVFAWTEPSQAPPGGNVPPPVTISTDQTITGLKTFNPLSGIVPFLVDASKSGLVTNLNSEKLGGFFAKDVAESGSTVGTITLGGVIRGGICGGWGCNYCVCYPDSTCGVQGKGSCDGTIYHGGTGMPANYTTYAPICDPGYSLVLVSVSGVNQSCASYVGDICSIKSTYQCIKSNIPFPGCGNGVVETGETCDDGNQLNNVGDCAANCSKLNYFSTPLAIGQKIRNDGASANQYCKEQGLANYAKFNDWFLEGYTWCDTFGGTDCPLLSYWDGSSWKTIQDKWTRYNIHDLWCSP